MDIYGEMMDAVYLYNKYGNPISSALWSDLRRLADWVCDNWQSRDNGIWEVRERPATLRLFQNDVLGGA